MIRRLTLRAAFVLGGSIACAIATVGPVLAASAGELWEVTVKMEMEGMPMALPPMTQRICIAPQAGDEAFVPKNDECRVADMSRSGNTQRYRMVCTGKDPMTAEGEITRGKDSYQGRMRMTGKVDGQAMNMTHTFSGRKVGPCSNPVR